MRIQPLSIAVALLLSLLLSSTALAAGTVVIPIRDTLDGDAAGRIAREIREAGEGGAGLVLLELDVDGAPDSGLALAESIRELRSAVRIAAFVNGRAPGSAVAVVLATQEVLASDGSTLGPIPEHGPIRDAVARAFADRGVPRSALTGLLPDPEVTGGLDAAAAETLGIVDRVVSDRTEALRSLGADPLEAEEPTPATPRGRLTVKGPFEHPYLIPFSGEIDETLAESVTRRVDEATAAGADLLIFEIDSPGGLVTSSLDIGELVFRTEIPSVMLILKEAYSGAALVALSGDEILMGPGAVLGDCQPIMITSEGYKELGEKIQSPLRAAFRKYALASGYPVALAESMVTKEMVVSRATFADGTILYLDPEGLAGAEKQHGKAVGVEVVVKASELLTMPASEAKEYGFTGDLVTGRADAYGRLGLDESRVVVLQETWSEIASRFLLSIKFLLFFGGLVAAWMEIKAPGFGVPGAIAIVCFVLFFAASSISGISTGIEVVLFLLGIALIALEVLVIPGFGVPGIAGFLLVVASLYLASVKHGFPSFDRPWEVERFQSWLLMFGATMLAVFIGIYIVAKALPGTPIGRRLILSHGGPEGSLGLTGSGSLEQQRTAALAGRTGRAISTLRPSGRIEVDGEPYNAVTQGDWIDAGEEIVVMDVRGNQITVRKA